MEQLTDQNPRSHSLYFFLKIWFRARNVIGTFERRAPGLVTEFRPGIAFTICTNHFHLPKNDRECLKLVSKMVLKKWKNKKQTNITTTFSDVPLLPEIFYWNDPKSPVPFTLQPDFPETFVNGKQKSQKEKDEKCPLSKNQQRYAPMTLYKSF